MGRACVDIGDFNFKNNFNFNRNICSNSHCNCNCNNIFTAEPAEHAESSPG
ncbi:MAG: hypothetical protein ACREKM_12070 [Longimicrobiales bacterium]